MIGSIFKSVLSFSRAPLASPQGLLSRAIQLALAFLIIHLCGLRDYTSFISGTSPSGEPLTLRFIMLGALYLLSFFAFALVVPILALGSLILYGMQTAGSRKQSGPPCPAQGPCPSVPASLPKR